MRTTISKRIQRRLRTMLQPARVASEIEDEMLESTASERRPESRLSCQLNLPAGLDELIVRIPPLQVL